MNNIQANATYHTPPQLYTRMMTEVYSGSYKIPLYIIINYNSLRHGRRASYILLYFEYQEVRELNYTSYNITRQEQTFLLCLYFFNILDFNTYWALYFYMLVILNTVNILLIRIPGFIITNTQIPGNTYTYTYLKLHTVWLLPLFTCKQRRASYILLICNGDVLDLLDVLDSLDNSDSVEIVDSMVSRCC